MPLSIGGGQLPISAFFGSASSSRPTSKTGNPRLFPKRKTPASAAGNELSKPPTKKPKQNENITPSRRHSQHKVSTRSSHTRGGSRLRRDTRVSPEGILDGLNDEEDLPKKTAPLCDVIDDTRTNTALGREAFCVDSPDGVGPYADRTKGGDCGYSSLTPERANRYYGSLAPDSLPSPPLTVPQAMRHRATRDDLECVFVEKTSGGPGSLPVAIAACNALPMTASTTDAPSNSDGARIAGESLRTAASLHDSPELMPPPPVPLLPIQPASPQLFSSNFATNSSCSERWVPSSQTQELTIPLDDDPQNPPSSNRPMTSSGRTYEIVPTSQSEEREMEMPPSPVGRSGGTDKHVIPECLGAIEDDAHTSIPSPDIVESSQSQIETEITPEWADILAARKAEIERPGKSVSRSQTLSPPPATVSQDYEAHDEYSSDSEPSLSHSNLRVFPPPIPSHMSESSGSCDSQPYLKTPTHLRRFRDMFEGRDERGSYLDSDAQATRADRSPSPSTDRPSHPGRDNDEDVLVHERVLPPPIPDDDGSYESSYGDSSSETCPTPVRMFLEMFSSDSE
ncbi:hypothetical protein C8Q80DRAFT_580041 [Daedaleopsis nitida]|nr:hypothetical protein C8Q80DRAFT_580041 [Daedaleopsis nitida]